MYIDTNVWINHLLSTDVSGSTDANLYDWIFDFIECFTTTFLRAHSWRLYEILIKITLDQSQECNKSVKNNKSKAFQDHFCKNMFY